MASIDFDLDDYLDEISDDFLLKELNRREILYNSSINNLDEETEFPAKLNSMEDVVKRDILVKWIENNFKRLSMSEFEAKFDMG